MKLLLTKNQDLALKKLIEIGTSKGREEDDVKGTILEKHIKDGWGETPARELDDLSVSEMGRALFNGYEIRKEILALQEYEVRFEINNFNTLKTLVSRKNTEKLSEVEVEEHAIEFANQLVKEKLDKSMIKEVVTLREVKKEE